MVKIFLSFLSIFCIQILSAQDNYLSLFRKGFFYLEVNDLKAIDFLSQAISLDSSGAEPYFYRGIANYKAGYYSSSISDFEKASALDTALNRVYALKSFAHRKMGETEQAVQSFNIFLKKAESDSSAYYYTTRGNLKIENNDYSGAIEDFNQASELSPDNEKVYYYRFHANYKIGDYRKALFEIDHLITLNPYFYGYYLYRGNTKLALGDFKNANHDYTKSIQLNERNADAYYLRGIVNDTLLLLNTAMEDYSKAIILKPEEGTYYSKRGNTKMKLGNKDGACLDWTIAGEFGYYKDFDKIKKVCQ